MFTFIVVCSFSITAGALYYYIALLFLWSFEGAVWVIYGLSGSAKPIMRLRQSQMTAEEDSLNVLSSIFNDRIMKSSSRLLILICLSMNKKLGFTEVSKLTGLAKGSLGNHISKLASSGYITVTEHSLFTSKRVIIRITEKGQKVIDKYVSALNELELREKREVGIKATLEDSSMEPGKLMATDIYNTSNRH